MCNDTWSFLGHRLVYRRGELIPAQRPGTTGNIGLLELPGPERPWIARGRSTSYQPPNLRQFFADTDVQRAVQSPGVDALAVSVELDGQPPPCRATIRRRAALRHAAKGAFLDATRGRSIMAGLPPLRKVGIEKLVERQMRNWEIARGQ